MIASLDMHVMRMLVILSRDEAVPSSFQTLAELDFLVRYPLVLRRAAELLQTRDRQIAEIAPIKQKAFEEQVPRLKHTRDLDRWGPIFGSLLGRGLATKHQRSLRPTEAGFAAVASVIERPVWMALAERAADAWQVALSTEESLEKVVESALPRQYVEDTL